VKRRLAAFVAAPAFALTLLLALAPSALASAHRPTAPAPVGLAGPSGGCTVNVDYHDFGGLDGTAASGTWETMATADLFVDPTRFHPCTGPHDTFQAGGISQWVAIQMPGSTNSIVQVGLIRCDYGYNDSVSTHACSNTHPNGLQYFYAWGRDTDTSCGFGSHKPIAGWLGDIDEGNAYWTNFKVRYQTGTDRVQFLIGGSIVKDISASTMCWLNSPSSRVGYYDERWDPNDGADGLNFKNAQYEINDDGVYRNDSWASTAACNLDPEWSCGRVSANWFLFNAN
jgi:hypothetical protein